MFYNNYTYMATYLVIFQGHFLFEKLYRFNEVAN